MTQEQKNKYKIFIDTALANGRAFTQDLIDDAIAFATVNK